VNSGRLCMWGPFSWRYEVTQTMFCAPVLHWELQLRLGRVCATLVISRLLR